MGADAVLALSRFEIDWAKNHVSNTYGKLFKSEDRQDVVYYDTESDGSNTREIRPAYRRSLASIRRRLMLLGYTISRCQEDYEGLLEWHQVDSGNLPLSWADFRDSVANINFDRPIAGDSDNIPREIAERILELPRLSARFPVESYERIVLEELILNVNPLMVLRLAAENPRNQKRHVTWRYADLLEYGWASESDIEPGLDQNDRFLVVTEGSSDSGILAKSLQILYPEVADFFAFIDMSEHYPFTGTGNLANFCKGLARINIQNKIIVVFDNDTAGHEAMAKLNGIQMPASMKLVTLPSLPHLKRFPTIGPNGERYENVDRRAASIELYLDLNRQGEKRPVVRWTAYNAGLSEYQGKLENKDEYIRDFHKKAGARGYSMTHLNSVWKSILSVCVGEEV